MPEIKDPYVYPGTSTLINKFDIQDPSKLQELEGTLFVLKSAEPLPSGNLDYNHLKAIHKHYFGDLYPTFIAPLHNPLEVDHRFHFIPIMNSTRLRS